MADLQRLLVETSRTFALNIPFLPEPLRDEVTIAYLLFRVADTLEDADRWPRDERMAALDVFCSLLETLDESEAQQHSRKWLQRPPLEHAGYLELLAELPALVRAFAAVRPAALPIIREHSLRTAKGMKETVARSDERGGLHLETLEELQDYCYLVAGIVGEMLTELLLLALPSSPENAAALRGRARAFGKGCSSSTSSRTPRRMRRMVVSTSRSASLATMSSIWPEPIWSPPRPTSRRCASCAPRPASSAFTRFRCGSPTRRSIASMWAVPEQRCRDWRWRRSWRSCRRSWGRACNDIHAAS